MEDLENATPFELAWPSANSSAAISLYDFRPPGKRSGTLQCLRGPFRISGMILAAALIYPGGLLRQ